MAETEDAWILAEAGGTPAYGATTTTTSSQDPEPRIYQTPPPGYLLHSIAVLYKTGYTPPAELAACAHNPALQTFYQSQNALLENFASAASQHPSPAVSRADWDFLNTRRQSAQPADESREDPRVRRAIILSNICNFILVIAQLYAFVTSFSLSLLAVFVDAVLDLVSGLVMLFTWSMKSRRDKHRYPVGRARLEPLGVIAMACLMTAATLVTLEQAVSALFWHTSEFSGLTVAGGVILLSALAIKFALFQYCKGVDDPSVQALAQDHFNDCLSNSVSFCTVLIAQNALWWVDPLGGIVISLLIIRNWTLHTLEHCDQLLGKAADREISNVVTFISCNHHPDIRLVDTVRAYHVGLGLYVEVDIVLAEDMPLHQAHDIGESLQVRIEKLEGVERCFVHIDTEARHSPSIEHKEL